jgi:pyruvate kinase
MRQLSLSFGVFADYVQMDVNSIKPLKKAVSRLVEEKCFKDDDLIIVLAGSFGMRHGASYIEISTAQNFKKRQT